MSGEETSGEAPTDPPAASDKSAASEDTGNEMPNVPATASDAALRVLAGWALLALLNQLLIALTFDTAPTARLGLLHHLYDAGQMLAAGLLAAAAVRLWPQRGWLARSNAKHAARWAGALALALLTAAADVSPRAHRIASGAAGDGLVVVMLALLATGVPLAWWLGKRQQRKRWQLLLLALALLVATLNHLLLPRNYPGIHLQLAASAATLLAALMPRPRLSRRARVALAAGCLVLALPSVLRPPSSTVLVRLLARPGAVVAPFVARLHSAWAMRQLAQQYDREKTATPPPAPPTQPPLLTSPIVILITVDCLRADLLERPEMAKRLPALWAMREQGAWFSHARTPAPATVVALAQVFSGRHFSQLYWVQNDDDWIALPYEDNSPRLPALLRAGGKRSATYHGVDWMQPRTGVVGRFDEHERITQSGPGQNQRYAPADKLIDAVITRLSRASDNPEGLFIYLHLLEAHSPYDLAEGDSPFERYLGELALIDRQLTRLQKALQTPALRDRTILMVSADHGEAFGEHFTTFHAVTIYDELARVPLLINGPSIEARHIRQSVSLLDLAPTVLDLFGLQTPGTMAGQSLVPMLRGQPIKRRHPVAIDSGRHARALVFEDGFKVIRDRRSGTLELYDLNSDPGELNNLVEALPHEAKRREQRLLSYFIPREHKREGYEIPFCPP